MEYIKFENTGMDVSRICLGCMSFGAFLRESAAMAAPDKSDTNAVLEKMMRRIQL